MITTDQMDEWIKEVEERPGSGPIIVRFVANRLRDLTKRNEELLAENIELRSGNKVEEYESRIANLEYQVELLKRQLGGDLSLLTGAPAAAAAVEGISLLVYTPQGLVLRTDLRLDSLSNGAKAARLAGAVDSGLRLLVTHVQEELLFVFDSGRTATLPVAELPALEGAALDWNQAYPIEPRAGETLAFVQPVAKMTLFDCCVQASRRGSVKKIMRTAFESHLAKNYIGTGVAVKPDQTCCLVLCGKDDRFVMASREGFLVSMDVSRLPYASEEAFRIGPTDYIVSGFIPGMKPTILVMTQNGKVLQRESGWLELAATNKTRGQPIFSQSRREAGVRVVGAAAVDEKDWSLALHRDGSLTTHAVADLMAAGAIGQGEIDLVDFAAFALPEQRKS